ncbi:MAG: sensor histidine kinase [Sandaracinaceae bacterium]
MTAETARLSPTSDEEVDASVAELNLRILQGLALYVADHCGADVLKAVAEAGDVQPSQLDGRSLWVSWERFERILAAAAEHVPTEDTFRRACAHRLAESYGPLLLLLKASSPAMVFGQAARSFPTISTISDARVEVLSRTSIRFHYRSRYPESRLMCLSRQGQATSLPTLWGLPPATLTEKSCIGWGDDACEYDLRWHASRRWLPVAGAAIGGAAVGVLAHTLGFDAAPWFGLLTTSTAGLYALALEQRKANTLNIEYAARAQQALGALATEEEEIRRELVALKDRQDSWLRRVEQELEHRTQELADLGGRVEGIQEKRVRVMRGQVHDLRNLLMVVSYAMDVVKKESLSPRAASSLADAMESTDRIQRILQQTMENTEPGRVLVALEPKPFDVRPLSEGLRRRLRAFAHGKDIRVSVFTSREAPKQITTDPLLLDRVLDNLLGNAAKYTESGSIVVEVGGTPGFLTVKISDTGPGIASERIARVFRPSGSTTDERVDGFGVGLSVVVQLLAQVGGRLEVMSKPGEGTTFWVHVPVDMSAVDDKGRNKSVDPSEGVEQLIRRVVHIRRVN